MSKVILRTVLCVLSAALIFLGGCGTLSSDRELQIRKYSRISDLNRRMLVEDTDTYLLLDRPSRLNEMHIYAD